MFYTYKNFDANFRHGTKKKLRKIIEKKKEIKKISHDKKIQNLINYYFYQVYPT